MSLLRPAITKERFKSRASKLSVQRMQIKICEKCFLCHSIVLCQSCYKCTKCCPQSSCRGQASELLENLAGPRCRSKGGSNPRRGLHPPLLDPTETSKISNRHKLLWQSPEEQLPAGGITSAYRQKCSRVSKKPVISELFQQIVSSPQTKQSVETDLGSEQSEFLPQVGKIQDRDPQNHQDIPPTGRVDHLHRLQGCILSHPDTGTVQEIPEISCSRTNLTIQSSTIRAFDNTTGIYCSGKRGQTDGHTQGYKDPPVPRRLVSESQILSSLSPTHTRTSTDMPEVRLDSKLGEIRTGAQTNLQFRRLPVRPEGRPGPAYTGPVADSPRENLGDPLSTDRQFMSLIGLLTATEKQVYLGRLHMRPIQWHLKNNWSVPEALEKVIPDCPGVAQHALVLGPSDHVQSGPPQPAQPAQAAHTALQSDPSQKSDKSKSPCLAPRATKIKEQGFSETVAARIEAPQRRSTRSVFEAKWAIFTKWCVTNQVDFRSPPVKSVADFLMYLFEDKKLQPSTINGYRSAIADKLGNTTVNISKDDNLTRLLESFHRDRPKGRRGIPSWTLSLVLHQLTKAPCEPLREASLKHLSFKTVFLLALGSGKRRSEIHAWQHKNIRHQSDWSKVSLFPSPSFLSKNQLAKEGPGSVAPVVIPALAPTLDKSLKSDRSLCPVRALHYYLDRTSDLRQNKELVFVSFKKGFDKDISPATISSWIKQTVILCYELSDHQAHTLHQVKAHDVRAFAASKAFQSGVSLDQILAACHWKSHNTFTQFYLKDVAWADSELFHLGPVVAAQQIHQ